MGGEPQVKGKHLLPRRWSYEKGPKEAKKKYTPMERQSLQQKNTREGVGELAGKYTKKTNEGPRGQVPSSEESGKGPVTFCVRGWTAGGQPTRPSQD